MARLFTCGFEENEMASKTMWSNTPTNSVVVTTAPHSGTYHLKSPTASAGPRRDLSTATGSITNYTRVYWQPNVFPTSGTTTQIFSWRDSGGANMFQIMHLRTSNLLRINNSKASTTVDSTFAVSLGVWYRLEVEFIQSATVGSITLKIYVGDSVNQVDSIALTNQNTGTLALQLHLNNPGGENQGQTWYFDDVAINDTSGSFQTSYVGPGKIALLKPNADTSVQWTKSGSSPAATNFGGVAEVPGTPDDAVTYNEDSGTSNIDTLALTDTPSEIPPTAIITLVDLYARVSAGAASQTLILRILDEASNATNGPSVSLGNGTWAFVTTAQHAILNTAGKTKANIDAFSAGYKGLSGASAKRVTSLWMNVEWIEANYYDVSPPKIVPQYVSRAAYI